MRKTCLALCCIVLPNLWCRAMPDTPKPPANVTLATAQDIVNNIYQAVGGAGRACPKVVVSTAPNVVARYFAGQIQINPKLFEVCASFGTNAEDALAIVLGHEMDHFFKKSNVPGDADFHLYPSDPATKEEADADVNGLFYAFLCGYDGAGEIFENFIAKVYDAFKLENDHAHPPLNTRRAAYAQIRGTARWASDIFETANCLALMGQHQPALACYRRLRMLHDGVELAYNEALIKLFELLDDGNQRLDPFFYPIELADESLFSKVRNTGGTIPDLVRERLDALEHDFSALSAQNPNFERARLAAFSVRVLLGQTKGIVPQLEQARVSAAERSYREKLLLLQAIAEAKNGDEATAKRLLNELAQSRIPQHRHLAHLNLACLEPGKALPKAPGKCLSPAPEVDGIGDSFNMKELDKDNFYDLYHNRRGDYQFYHSKKKSSTLLALRGAYSGYVFQRLNNVPPLQDYSKQAYWTYGAGAYLYLPDCGMILRLSANGQVISCLKVIALH